MTMTPLIPGAGARMKAVTTYRPNYEQNHLKSVHVVSIILLPYFKQVKYVLFYG